MLIHHIQDSAVNFWLEKGFPAERIILGVPIYGRSFTLEDPALNGWGAPAKGEGVKGELTRLAGTLGYHEVN